MDKAEQTTGRRAAERSVLALGGGDRETFLQDLVTNDLRGLAEGLVYAALLTPQGKYLFDFFLQAADDAILVDVASDRAAALAQRLSMYRLRADVTISAAPQAVVLGFGAAPAGALPDPRHPSLGWRWITDTPAPELVAADPDCWTTLRIRHLIPETGIELRPDDTYILEAGLDRLNGVDFRKGCYVGQEVTARMRHKTELKKGLRRVRLDGAAPPPGTPVLAGEREAGTLFTVQDGQGLAHLRFDRATGEMQAGEARVTLDP